MLQEDVSQIKARWWLLACTLLALCLRVYHLGFQSLWIDELYSMNMADPAHSLRDIYALSKTTDGLSVFYFVILNAFFRLFGFTAVVARAVSVLAAIAAVPGIYLLGRELFNRRAGLIASFLLSLNYFHIYYSQEARSYAMFATFTIFSFLFLLRFIRHQDVKHSIYYGICALLMIWSHFFGLFVLISQIVLLGIAFMKDLRTTKKSFLWLCALAGLIVLIGFLPILPIFRTWANVKSFWIPPVPGDVFFKLYGEFFGHSWIVICTITLFIVYYIFRVFMPEEQAGMPASISLKRSFYILLVWILVSFMIPFLRSLLVVPMLQSRYMIAILPAILLAAAGGISMVNRRWFRNSLILVVGTVSLSDLFVARNYYQVLTKSNFRDAAEFVVSHNASHTKIMSTLPYHFRYYLELYKSPIPVDTTTMKQEIADMMKGRLAQQPFWILEAHHMELNLPDSGKAFLNKHFRVLERYESTGSWAKLYAPMDQNMLYLGPADFKVRGRNDEPGFPLFYNSTVSSRPLTLDTGAYRLVIYTESVPMQKINGEYAHLNISLGKMPLGSLYSGPSSITGDTLSFFVHDKTPYALNIGFDNDVYTDSLDRNVIIRDVVISKE